MLKARELVEGGGHRDGKLGMAVSNAIVHVVREYTGRGPTQARAEVTHDLVTVLMADMLTKSEKRLAADGEAELVLTVRRKFQETMRRDLVAAVERTTGRKVVAFMSDNHIEPDLAVEAFVLQPSV
jgi:uncharacterized protein YbcI